MLNVYVIVIAFIVYVIVYFCLCLKLLENNGTY